MATSISKSTPKTVSTPPLHTESKTIQSRQNNFEDTKKPNKTKQSNLPINKLKKTNKTKQDINIVDIDTRFVGQGVLDELVDNSKYHNYSNYLNTRKISNSKSLEDILYSLEKSKIFAETVLKLGSIELIDAPEVSKMSKDKYTAAQLASIYGRMLNKTLALFLVDAIYIQKGIPVHGLSLEDQKYLTEKFESFLSNKSLEKLLKLCKDEKDVAEKFYFIGMVAASLSTKSGDHESYTYLAALRQALYCNDKNEVVIKYESNCFSSVRQGDGIIVPGTSGLALYRNDVKEEYKQEHKNDNQLDFIVTKEMAALCCEMIEDMHNLFDKILLAKSVETQNASEEKKLNNSNLQTDELSVAENNVLYLFSEFEKAKKALQEEIKFEETKKALFEKAKKSLQEIGFEEARKALQEIEKESIQEKENVEHFSLFNDEAEKEYQKWLETKTEKPKSIA